MFRIHAYSTALSIHSSQSLFHYNHSFSSLHSVVDKRSPLLVMMENTTDSLGLPEPVDADEDPKGADGGKDQGDSRDESRSIRAALPSPDTKERPSDGNGTSEVTFGRGECVSDGGSFEDGGGEEDEDFGPYAGTMGSGVDAKGFKAGDEDEDGDPSVGEGEWQVDKDLVGNGTGAVVSLDDPVNVGDCRVDKEREDKGPNVMSASPNVDVDGDQNSEDGEPPTDTVNDDCLSLIGKLIDEITEEKEMNE